jgi:hypothetical protein
VRPLLILRSALYSNSCRLHYLALAATHGLAIMGSGALSRDQTLTDDVLIGALNSIAVSSDRPELAQAPLLIFGISAGAPQSYGFTLRRSDRVIGFMVITGSTPSTVRSGAAQRVPGYVLLAELDTEVNNGKLTEFFVDNRAEGALWTFAVEPGAIHQPPSLAAQSLLVEWMDTILQLRLPPTVTPSAAAGEHHRSFRLAGQSDQLRDRRLLSLRREQARCQLVSFAGDCPVLGGFVTP